jgi:hypothetical protein
MMNNQWDQNDFRLFVEETLKQWQVPGVAIAIVQNDQTILCEGFGLRNVEQNLPVTAETVFPIASCTKAFTAMTCYGMPQTSIGAMCSDDYATSNLVAASVLPTNTKI